MYVPKHFNESDERALKLIGDFPFATLLSTDENGQPFVGHLPLLLEKDDGRAHLVGHVAKRNPQWMHFRKNPNATIVFHGPSTYITPNWYVSGRDVPTWNYAVVHTQSTVKLIEDYAGIVEILKKMTKHFEAGSANPWEFELPSDLIDPTAITSALVGFEISIEKIEAKFKLSQNRPEADRMSVIDGLGQRADQMSHLIRDLMKSP